MDEKRDSLYRKVLISWRLFTMNLHFYLPNSRREVFFFCFGIVCAVVLVSVINERLSFNEENFRDLTVPMEHFPEKGWRTAATLAVKTVTSTPFARFEIHKVKTESGAIINDWLWTDERSHVNILVHLKAENRYLLFHQKKYGLERPYYAAVGGLFDIGDTPMGCATRELLEETGLEAEMTYLGRYRVQVNRGGGILHAFYAKNAVPSKNKKASDDYEKQEHRKLTRDELLAVLLAGEIGEAQWLATIALGLLHEEHAETAAVSAGVKLLKENIGKGLLGWKGIVRVYNGSDLKN